MNVLLIIKKLLSKCQDKKFSNNSTYNNSNIKYNILELKSLKYIQSLQLFEFVTNL